MIIGSVILGIAIGLVDWMLGKILVNGVVSVGGVSTVPGLSLVRDPDTAGHENKVRTCLSVASRRPAGRGLQARCQGAGADPEAVEVKNEQEGHGRAQAFPWLCLVPDGQRRKRITSSTRPGRDQVRRDGSRSAATA